VEQYISAGAYILFNFTVFDQTNKTLLSIIEKKLKKGGQVGTALLDSSCRVCHCNFECVIFEFNDKSINHWIRKKILSGDGT